MSIDRYDFGRHCVQFSDDNGDFVLYEDHKKEIQRLRDLLDRAYLENRKYGHIGLVTCGHIEAELQEQSDV